MDKARLCLVVVLLFTIPTFAQQHAIPASFPFLYKCNCERGGIGEALVHSFARLLRAHSEYRIPKKDDGWFLQIETNARGKPFKMSNGYSAVLVSVAWERVDVLPGGSLKTTAVTGAQYLVTNAPENAWGLPEDVMTVDQASSAWLYELTKLVEMNLQFGGR